MDESLTVADQVNYMRNSPQRGVFNAAVRDDSDEVVGLQSVEPLPSRSPAMPHVGEISTFVALDARGRGIGSRLTNATMPEAMQRGFLKIIASVRADNPRAVEFYRRQGFNVIGTARQHALVRGRFVDQIMMERWIGDSES